MTQQTERDALIENLRITQTIAELRTAHAGHSDEGPSSFSDAADALEAQAQRIAELEQDRDEWKSEAMHGGHADNLRAERDTLRKELEAIKAQEPVAWIKYLIGSECKPNGQCYDVMFVPLDGYTPLYSSPVAPAQPYCRPQSPEQPKGDCKLPKNGVLFDSQWVNIVNAPEVLNAVDKEEAVNHAVKLAEKAFISNLTLLQATEQPAQVPPSNICKKHNCMWAGDACPYCKDEQAVVDRAKENEIDELRAAATAIEKLETALRLVMDCAGDIQSATDAELEAALSCGDPDTEKQANAWLVARAALLPDNAEITGLSG